MRTDQSVLSPRNVVLFGCGGHARSVADVFLKSSPHGEILFIDEKGKPGEKIMGFPVLSLSPIEKKERFIAIGDNGKRKNLWEKCPLDQLITIIAPSAHIGCFSMIGKGVFMGNSAHIGPEAKIGDNTIVNTGAIVEHEVIIGAHSHIGPNAVISGRCHIGELVFIGVGAVVRDSVRIGSNIIIGAGAVVVKDLLEPGIYIGNPARALRLYEPMNLSH